MHSAPSDCGCGMGDDCQDDNLPRSVGGAEEQVMGLMDALYESVKRANHS